MRLEFKPWREFTVVKDQSAIADWIYLNGMSIRQRFLSGLVGRHSGRMYGSHRASAPGEYPANKSGALLLSLQQVTQENEVEVGSTIKYARFLRAGTLKMAPRKMFREAVQEAKRPQIGRFVEFRRL